MSTQENPTRRYVVSSGLALAGGCFAGLDPRALISHAAAQGRPLLTDRNLNALIPDPAEGDRYAAFLDEAASDLPGFLARRFALTDEQIQEVATIPRGQLKAEDVWRILPDRRGCLIWINA